MRTTARMILHSAVALFLSTGLLLDWLFFKGNTRLRLSAELCSCRNNVRFEIPVAVAAPTSQREQGRQQSSRLCYSSLVTTG